jgi:hypothetical protein
MPTPVPSSHRAAGMLHQQHMKAAEFAAEHICSHVAEVEVRFTGTSAHVWLRNMQAINSASM